MNRRRNGLSATVSTVNTYDFTAENFFQVPGMQPSFNPDRDNKVTAAGVYLENRTQPVPALNLVAALRHELINLDLTRSYSVRTGESGPTANCSNVPPDASASFNQRGLGPKPLQAFPLPSVYACAARLEGACRPCLRCALARLIPSKSSSDLPAASASRSQ